MNNKNTNMKTTDNIPPIAPTQKTDSTPSVRCRNGKIARLPLAIREQLNQRLLEGQEGKPLLEWLNALPEVRAVMEAQFHGSPVREQNLSEWRKGGHQTWKKEKETQQTVTSFLEKVDGLEAVAKDGLTEQLAFFAAARMALELTRLEEVPDGAEKAKTWRELTAGLVALRRGDIDLERLRLQREKYGLCHKTKEELEAEFWKWADDNINRDEFCRRRCFTYEQREAAVDRILGITPEERHETVPPPAEAPSTPDSSNPDPALIRPNPTQSDSIRPMGK
jgi:hypothetical protein